MTLYDAISQRHSIRAYEDRPLDPETVATLRDEITRINEQTGLHIQLVLNEPKAFKSLMAKYGSFRGCSNYIVMAGMQSETLDETVGYYGEKLVLLAQTMGVCSCWVGLTYKKVPGAFELKEGEKVPCVISLGYPAGEGRKHGCKTIQDISNCSDLHPEWFRFALESVLLAPTAVNQQKFRFDMENDLKTVTADAGHSLVGYTKVDLGIAKCHFELAVEQYGRMNDKVVEYKLVSIA